MFNARNEAREELKRETLEAGLMSDRFPGVASIVVNMNYKKARATPVIRTVNFTPASPAFFRISCLGENCQRGGLELKWVINRMIRSHERSAQGELKCENQNPAILHAEVDYNVTITYA